jgi:hypothetical protein
MTAEVPEMLGTLLRESLATWGVAGAVSRAGDGSLQLSAGQLRLAIVRAPRDLPFRWLVVSNDRSRGASGIAGLLRTVRAAVDPNYRPIRVRIAALPPAP